MIIDNKFSPAPNTAAVSNPVSYYNRGLELFDKEKYGSAIHEFEDFSENNPRYRLQKWGLAK
jgi:TolA-binding protein